MGDMWDNGEFPEHASIESTGICATISGNGFDSEVEEVLPGTTAPTSAPTSAPTTGPTSAPKSVPANGQNDGQNDGQNESLAWVPLSIGIIIVVGIIYFLSRHFYKTESNDIPNKIFHEDTKESVEASSSEDDDTI